MRKLFDVLFKSIATVLVLLASSIFILIMLLLWDAGDVFGDMPAPPNTIKNIWKL